MTTLQIQESCHQLNMATQVEESSITVESLPPSITPLAVVPEIEDVEEDQEVFTSTTTTKISTATVELTKELADYIRQESNTSNVSLEEVDDEEESSSSTSSQKDGDDSSSLDGGDGGVDLEPRGHRSASVVSDASEEGGRDSGIEAEREPDMVVPDQDLIDRIVTQVEIYFSDANVLKDKFLLKHIRRNKEGYVSLKLVSSFKKVKQLTKDWRVVAFALNKSSTNIQINDLGTKIRRITALPEIDDTPVTCTILALNLPLEKPGIDTVSQLFGKCGDIALIRVLKAGANLSPDLKPLASKYQSLNTTNCAWIEFETPEAVKEACKMTSDEGMKVVPIVSESPKKSDKQTQQQKNQTNSRKSSLASQNSYNTMNSMSRNPNNNQQRKYSAKYNRQFSDQDPFPYHHNNNYNINKAYQPQRRKAISLPHNQRPNIRDLTVIVEGRRRPKSKSCIEFPGQGSSSSPSCGGGAAQQSWVQRHLFAAAAASAASAASPTLNTLCSAPCGGSGGRQLASQRSRVSLGTLSLPEGVMRFPKGPDGSKGFGGRRISEIAGVNLTTS